jgi:DNA polymerase III alpha subunit (gram-positive type)
MKYTLLITSCIQPNFANMNTNFRSNSALRLSDYITAFRYWLSYKEDKVTQIIFVENSGYDLAELKQIATKENLYNRTIEFIQFEATAIPLELHYGYSELEILDKAFDLSKTISETDSFIKVTGRLYFPSLNKLLKKIQINNDITIDFKDYKFFHIKKQYALTTLIVINNDFFLRNLYGIKSKMDTENFSHFETCYYKFLQPLSFTNKNIVTRFPVNVNPIGMGAHWNSDYNSSSKKAFNFIRGVLRVICPNFKI